MQRRPSGFDVGPTLYKWYTNVLCLLGCVAELFAFIFHLFEAEIHDEMTTNIDIYEKYTSAPN